MIKELWDYFKTLKKDGEYNNELFIKLSPNLQQKPIKSKDIKVGDFIILQKNQRVPVTSILFLSFRLIWYFFILPMKTV